MVSAVEIEIHAREIVQELRGGVSGRIETQKYVSFNAVASLLAYRYSVVRLEDLGCTVAEIETLKVLHIISELADAHIFAQLHSSPIVTMVDIEESLRKVLSGLNISKLLPCSTNSAIDPQEIDLSEPSEERIQGNECLGSWGVGNFRYHPQVLQLLGPPPYHMSTRPVISAQEVSDRLLNFLTRNFDTPNDHKFNQFSAELCSNFGVSSVLQCDVYLNPCKFRMLCTALEVTNSLNEQVQQRQIRQQFEGLQRSSIADQSVVQPRKRDKIRVQSLKLKELPHDSEMCEVLQRVKKICSSQSSFEPSRSKIHRTLTECLIYSSAEDQPSGSKRKRAQHQQDKPIADVHSLLMDIASEYFFLHLGSRSEISKRYDFSESEAEAEVPPVKSETAVVESQLSTLDASSSASESCQVDVDVVVSKVDTVPFEGKRDIRIGDSSMCSSASALILDITNAQLMPTLMDIFIPTAVTPEVVGRVGECIVYNHIKRSLASTQIEEQPTVSEVVWLNETDETRAPYDITVSTYLKQPLSTDHNRRNTSELKKVFVEVKSTKYDSNNVFALSMCEWQFISSLPPTVEYHIYRVFSAVDKTKTRVVVLRDVRKLLECGRIQLCLAT